MAFTPEPEFPDLSQLLTSLNQSQISSKNPPLYQTIKGLIQKVQQLKGLAQEDIDAITQNITDLSNTVNNFSISGNVTMPPPWMPVFDGEDGEDGFPIVGPQGPRGEDGKTIPPFCDCEYIEPPPLLAPCCSESASEVSFTTTGNIDDLDFANAKLIRMNNASLATIRGLKAGRAGQIVTIVSVGAGQVDLADTDAGSAAANQLLNVVRSANTSLSAGVGTVTYQYDATTPIWRMVAHDQGEYITPTFAAGDYTASGGGGAWTVASGDVDRMAYKVIGRSLHVIYSVVTSDVTGAANTQLRRTIPGGYSPTAETINNSTRIAQGGVFASGGMVTVSGTTMNFFVDGAGGTNWAAGVGGTAVQGNILFSIS